MNWLRSDNFSYITAVLWNEIKSFQKLSFDSFLLNPENLFWRKKCFFSRTFYRVLHNLGVPCKSGLFGRERASVPQTLWTIHWPFLHIYIRPPSMSSTDFDSGQKLLFWDEQMWAPIWKLDGYTDSANTINLAGDELWEYIFGHKMQVNIHCILLRLTRDLKLSYFLMMIISVNNVF